MSTLTTHIQMQARRSNTPPIINPITGSPITATQITAFCALADPANNPFRGGGGGPPGRPPGGRNGSGGGPPAGNPPAGVPMAPPPIQADHSKFTGNPPAVFSGDREKAEEFLMQWNLYEGINAAHPIIRNSYQKAMLFLTYIQEVT
jgi:hypothetical protein